MAKSLKLTLKISGSDALVKNQGYTYNQAGFTYNQAGVMYGGVYNQNEDIIPALSVAKQLKPSLYAKLIKPQWLKIKNTQAQLYSQGITYNQTGVSYNDIRYAYGGVYNQNEDIIPALQLASTIRPHLKGIFDIGSKVIPPNSNVNSGMLIAPGLPFQFLTYP